MRKKYYLILLLAATFTFLATQVVVDSAVYKFPENPYFQQINTVWLFKDTGETADSVILERVSAQSNQKHSAYRMKVNKTGKDTIFSKIFPVVSANTAIYVTYDSLAGDSGDAKLSIGLYRGLGFGDSLGFIWYPLETFAGNNGGTDTAKYVLKDSSWFADEASPYAMLRIEEVDSTILGWMIDIFGYEGRGK